MHYVLEKCVMYFHNKALEIQSNGMAKHYTIFLFGDERMDAS